MSGPSEEERPDGKAPRGRPGAADDARDGQPSKDADGHRPGFWAQATDQGRIYQSQGPMNVSERDLHQHFEDGVHRTRKVEPGHPAGQCPYPGLTAFDTDQAHWFFGREPVTQSVLDRLGVCLRQGGAVMVTAPSGAGKSSILRAGVLAAVAQGALGIAGSDRWPRVVFTPSARPLEALAANLARAAGDGQPWSSILADGPAACVGQMRSVLRDRDPGRDGTGSRWVLVVDQLEELFTQCPSEAEREQFLALLEGMSEPGGDGRSPVALVLYGVRSDFLTPCADYAHLRAANDNGLLMGPMSEEELRAAILFPARREGMEVESGLVGVLLGDLGEPLSAGGPDRSAEGAGSGRYEAGRLPLLAHALRTTWQQSPGGVLTVDGYAATGGIARALAATADRTFQMLKPAGRQMARVVLLALVRLGEGTEDTRRRLKYTDLLALSGDPHTAATVVEEFTRARLLTRQVATSETGLSDRDGSTVEITHDVLLRAWPKLREWIDEDRDGNLLRQHVEESAAGWEQAGRDPNLLYRGSRLDAALGRQPTAFGGSWSPAASAFLTAGRRQQQRATAGRRAAIAVLSVLTLVASLTAIVAFDQRSEARKETRTAVVAQHDAQSKQLAAESTSLADTDPDLSSLLSVKAWETSHTPEAAAALYAAPDVHLRRILPGSAFISSLAWSPDGRTLAANSSAAGPQLWNTAPGGSGRTLKGGATHLFSMAFSHDGRFLATGSLTHNAQIWNITAGKLVSLTGHAESASVAFSPDGTVLAVGGTDGHVRLWSVSTGKQMRNLTGGTGIFYSTAFSPDGSTLAVGSSDGTVRRWNTAKDNPLPVLRAAPDSAPVFSVAFSPDGKTLATGSDDTTAKLWNTATGALLRTFQDGGSPVYSVAFSPGGNAFAVGCGDGTARLWSTAKGAPLAEFGGHTDAVWSVAFSPDGKILATGSWDKTVRLWNTSPEVPVATLTSAVPPVTAFSTDGRLLATGGENDSVRLTDRTGALVRNLYGHTAEVASVAFSPDGRLLATGSYDHTVRLWDTGSGALVRRLEYPAEVMSVAFSPDGKTIAAGGFDDKARLWSASTGAEIATLRCSDLVYSVAYSPDGRTLATGGSDFTIQLWSTSTDHLVRTLKGHTASVEAITFSPDGKILATGSQDTTIRLWDTKTGTTVRTLTGHTGTVSSLTFSPGGQFLASGSYDASVRLWSVETGAVVRTLTGHVGKVNSVAFSADGREMATGGYDGTTQMWNAVVPDASSVRGLLCASLHRDFTVSERSEYLDGQSSEPVLCHSEALFGR